jgi:hypothetical protein
VTIADRLYVKLQELGRDHPISGPGYYNGRHFTTFVREVEILKKRNNEHEVEDLLFELIKATEEECMKEKNGVAPWYYNELAVLFRKQKEYQKEVAILERFANQQHAPGAMPAKLLVRLEKARELARSV